MEYKEIAGKLIYGYFPVSSEFLNIEFMNRKIEENLKEHVKKVLSKEHSMECIRMTNEIPGIYDMISSNRLDYFYRKEMMCFIDEELLKLICTKSLDNCSKELDKLFIFDIKLIILRYIKHANL